jgi:predicted nuclease of predicted toxin-antitoxin system
MKILLDECVPQDLCKSFPDHECHGARRSGFGGKKNSELLALAEEAGFNVLLTVDQGFLYQQNIAGRKIALFVVRTRSNKLQDLLPYVPACLRVLRSIKPGKVEQVG